jgi:hypothetical protein
MLQRKQDVGRDQMYTQRKNERRSFKGKTSFPLVTNEGCEVEKDRRCLPDRRLGNIHLELDDVANREYSRRSSNAPLFSLSD